MGDTKLTNSVNIVIMVFVIGIFAFLISNYGEELKDNPHAQLSANSDAYITNLNSVGVAGLNTTIEGLNTDAFETNIQDPLDSDTADSKLDFALDFVFGKKVADSIKGFLYVSLSFPEWLLVKVFKFSLGDWSWIINLLKWLWRILIVVAIVYFWRNR